MYSTRGSIGVPDDPEQSWTVELALDLWVPSESQSVRNREPVAKSRPRSLPKGRACADGDRVELEDVFREHQRSVYAFFLRVVGNRHDAEELTQETFVRACSSALRFRGDASVRTWLFAIARHVLLETRRKGGPRKRASDRRGFRTPRHGPPVGSLHESIKRREPDVRSALRGARHG
jgi:DNA-directed RNA polymerase specialized sigma24 family protein